MRENAAAGERARLFFALWPKRGVRRGLAGMAAHCLAACGGRAMRPQTLHLTLLFLGDVPRAQIEQIQQAAACVSGKPFVLQLQQLACWRHNRIAYAAPQPAEDGLLSLAAALRCAMERIGVACDRQPFVPHVTLLRNIVSCPETLAMPPLAWQVDEFALVQSLSDGSGARYATLASWKLQ